VSGLCGRRISEFGDAGRVNPAVPGNHSRPRLVGCSLADEVAVVAWHSAASTQGHRSRAAPNQRRGRTLGSSCSTPREHQQFALRKRWECALGDPGPQWPGAAAAYIPGAALTRIAGDAGATGNSVGRS
jgi:hypothetical protein